MQAVDATLVSGMDLFIQTVVTKSRLYSEEFIRFLEYFNKIGVGVFVTFIKPIGTGKDMKAEMCDKDDFAYFGELEKKYNTFWHLTCAYGRDIGCIAYKAMCSITAFGDVNPCPYWFKPLGNIFQEPLKDILDRALRTPPFDKHIDTCPIADVAWLGKT